MIETRPFSNPAAATRGRPRRGAASRILVALLLVLLLPAGCRSTARAPEDESPEGTLERARSALEQGRFRRARALARGVLDEVEEGDPAAEAAFLAAEADFRRGYYKRALEQLRKYPASYPTSGRLGDVEDRLFEIGMLFLRGKARGFLGLFPNRGRGITALEAVLEGFPRGDRALEAQRELAGYYFDRGSYGTALGEYRELMRRFPDSEWVPLAHFRSGMCYIEQSRGPEYDPSLLSRAREEFRLYVELYPEAPRLEEAKRRIRGIDEAMAGRLYRIGRFYEREGKPKGARFYFEKLQRDHPKSAWSAEAGKRLARLGGREGGP